MYSGYVFKRNCPISPPAMQKVYSVLWGTMMMDFDSEEEAKTSVSPKLVVEILGVAEWDGVGRANQYANGFLVVTHTGGTYYIATPSTKDRDEWILQVKQALECNFANSDINPFKPSKMVQVRPERRNNAMCPVTNQMLMPSGSSLSPANYCGSCGRGFSSAEFVKELCTMLPLGNEECEFCCLDCKNSQSLVYWLKMVNYNNGMYLHNHSPSILCDINRYKATFKITRRTSKQLETAAVLQDNGSIDADEFRELVTLNVAVNNEMMSQDSLKLREALDAIGDDMQMVLTIMMSSTTTERGGRSSYFQIMDKLLYLADTQPLLIDFYWPQLLQVHLIESSNRTPAGLMKLDLLQQTLLAISQRYPSLASRMAWSLMSTASDYVERRGGVTSIQFASSLSLLFQLDFVVTGSVSAIADVPQCRRLVNIIGAANYQQTEIGLELSILFLARSRLQEMLDKETREMAARRLSLVSLHVDRPKTFDVSPTGSNNSLDSIDKASKDDNSKPTSLQSNLIAVSDGSSSSSDSSSDSSSNNNNCDSSRSSSISNSREGPNESGEEESDLKVSLTCNQLFYGMGVMQCLLRSGSSPSSAATSATSAPSSPGPPRCLTSHIALHNEDPSSPSSPTSPASPSPILLPSSLRTTLWTGFSKQVDFVYFLTEMVEALRFVDRPLRTDTFKRDVFLLNKGNDELLPEETRDLNSPSEKVNKTNNSNSNDGMASTSPSRSPVAPSPDSSSRYSSPDVLISDSNSIDSVSSHASEEPSYSVDGNGTHSVGSTFPTNMPLPSLGWDVVTSCAGDPIYRICRIFAEECRVFRTKARAPSLVVCEVKRDDSNLLTNPLMASIKQRDYLQMCNSGGHRNSSSNYNNNRSSNSNNSNSNGSQNGSYLGVISDSALNSSESGGGAEVLGTGSSPTGHHMVNTNHVFVPIQKRSMSGSGSGNEFRTSEEGGVGLANDIDVNGSIVKKGGDLSLYSNSTETLTKIETAENETAETSSMVSDRLSIGERISITPIDVNEVDSIVKLGIHQFIDNLQKNRSLSADYDDGANPSTSLSREEDGVEGQEEEEEDMAKSCGDSPDLNALKDKDVSSPASRRGSSNGKSNNNMLSLRLINPGSPNAQPIDSDSSSAASATAASSTTSAGNSPSGDQAFNHNLRRRRSWITKSGTSTSAGGSNVASPNAASGGGQANASNASNDTAYANSFQGQTSSISMSSSGQRAISPLAAVSQQDKHLAPTRRQSFLASNQKTNSFFSSLVTVNADDLKSLSVSVSGVTLSAPSTDIKPTSTTVAANDDSYSSGTERNSILSSLSESNCVVIPPGSYDASNANNFSISGGLNSGAGLLDVEGDLEEIVVAPLYEDNQPEGIGNLNLKIIGWMNVTRKVLFSAQKLLLTKKIDILEYNSLINSDSKYRDAWNKEVEHYTKSRVETAFGEGWKDKKQRLLGNKMHSKKDIVVYEALPKLASGGSSGSNNENDNIDSSSSSGSTSSLTSPADPPDWDYVDSANRNRPVSRVWPLWDLRCFIVKSNDDLRQEILCLQLMQLCHDIFQDVRLDHLLWLKPYSIISTGSTTGLVEVIPDTMSVDSLKKTDGFVSLSNYFKLTYGSSLEKLGLAKRNLASSLAAYSIFCYVFAVKDRHNGNILLDTEGHLIHIDFGFILSIAPGGSFSLESAPFKLTEEVVDALGGLTSSHFGEFVKAFTLGFLALRSHMSTIIGLVEVISSQSPFPCFAGKDSASVVDRIRQRLRGDLSVKDCVKHCMDLIALSYAALGTKQYDSFQWYSNGICP